MDFITPVIDDPYQWGRIAAANSLSDVFAMGGRPFVALNLVCFPLNCLPIDQLKAVMQGGADAVAEASAMLVGGHSIEDQEPKYGLCVYGEGHHKRIWRTTGAKTGDLLVLTKKIGTGPLATAVKASIATEAEIADLTTSMAKLNNLPNFMDEELSDQIHSCTDVTGFGLAGHLLDMVSDGKTDIVLDLSSIPLLNGATKYASMGLLPEGAYRNRQRYSDKINYLRTVENVDMLFDPQTSGGLLFTITPEKVQPLLDLGAEHDLPIAVIGQIDSGSGKLQVQ